MFQMDSATNEVLVFGDRLTRGGDNHVPKYLPTPEEIATETERLKSTWTDEEREQRAGMPPRKPYKVPVVSERELLLAILDCNPRMREV
jgi:hypothetical protein